MKLEYSKKDVESIIDFTLNSKTKNIKYIFKKWEKIKSLKLTDEELKSLTSYKIFEHKIQDDVLLLHIKNTSIIEEKIVEKILKKYGTYNYYQFFNDDYASHYERIVIINLDKLKFEVYKDDKYMKYYENNNYLMFKGSDHEWREEFEEVNDYYDKYCLTELRNLVRAGYLDINFKIYNFKLLRKDDANIETKPAIEVLERVIKNRKIELLKNNKQ